MKRVMELLSNIAIVITSLIVLYMFVHLQQNAPKPIAIGDTVNGIDITWRNNEHTLLFALNKGCHFCEQSAPFYKQLLARTRSNYKIRAVAGLPQNIDLARDYLKELGLAFSTVVKLDFRSLRVRGTPTLLLIDAKGKVERQWVGLLTHVQESEILSIFN